MGKGGAAIFDQIKKDKSISKAAENLGMSYRYVWNYLDEIRKIIGEPVVETFRGGKDGGGGTKLTKTGEYLLKEYNRVHGNLENFVSAMGKGR